MGLGDVNHAGTRLVAIQIRSAWAYGYSCMRTVRDIISNWSLRVLKAFMFGKCLCSRSQITTMVTITTITMTITTSTIANYY